MQQMIPLYCITYLHYNTIHRHTTQWQTEIIKAWLSNPNMKMSDFISIFPEIVQLEQQWDVYAVVLHYQQRIVFVTKVSHLYTQQHHLLHDAAICVLLLALDTICWMYGDSYCMFLLRYRWSFKLISWKTFEVNTLLTDMFLIFSPCVVDN